MKIPKTITEIMQHTMRAPIIEPVKRVKCLYHVPRGMRNAPEPARYIWHRYPIIGGINGSKLMAALVTSGDALFRKLLERGPK